MANKNKNHSFYKESQKSILGQESWDAKRVFKTIFKILKWLLFGYLIIITLWGCVNEFIIHTSKNLGQGVEFYQEDDFLYPNMYQTKKVVGYQKIEGDTAEYVYGEKTDASSIATSAPIDTIKYENPYYGPFAEGEDFDDPDGVFNTTDKYLTGDQWFTVQIDDEGKAGKVTASPKAGTYNFNWITFISSGASTYDAEALIANGYVPTASLPYALRDKENDIYTVADFANANESWWTIAKGSLVDGVDYITNKDGEVVSFNGAFNADGTSFVRNMSAVTAEQVGLNFNEQDKWTDVEKEEYELTKIYNSLVNIVAFSSGTGSIGIGNQATLYAIKSDYEITSDYTADYSAALSGLTGGAQVFAVPNAKGHPVQLTQESQDLIDSYRKENSMTYDDIDLEQYEHEELLDTDIAFDPSSYMYGWIFADGRENENGQHDILMTYKNEWAAIKGYEKGITGEESQDMAFYADQRRNGWGQYESSDEGSVFDEKAKASIGSDKYLSLSLEFTDGNEYTFASQFAGVTSLTQIDIQSEEFRGVLPQYQPFINDSAVSIGGSGTDKDHKRGYYTYEELTDGSIDGVTWEERSVLSDSVIPTREDSYGESRVAFVGWSDWGKAWEIQYGPLYGTVVFPLAQISMAIGEWFGYMSHPWGTLASIALIVFLTRGLAALFSIKGTKNQMKMQEVQTEVAKIKARYSKYDLKQNKKMKQKQQQEIMALYRKNDVNPMGSLGTIFITMPIFISLWIIISALPAYKLVIMGNFSWAISAWAGIFGEFGALFLVYLMVGIAVGLVQGISSKLPAWLANKRKGIKRLDDATKEAQKKNNKTQNIMVGVFVFMGLTVPALFAFYWICSGLFTIFLELMRHGWRTHTAKMVKEDPSYQTPGVRITNKFKAKLAK